MINILVGAWQLLQFLSDFRYRIIGPYFFENEAGRAVSINGDRYRGMLQFFFWSEIEDMNVSDMWFQQDGARPHTAAETMAIVNDRFPDRTISQGAKVEWPPRSCDLTPLDFFLWGYVKDKVYANNPKTIPQLKAEIIRVMNGIEASLLESVIENLDKRIKICKKSRGGHLHDIHFHT